MTAAWQVRCCVDVGTELLRDCFFYSCASSLRDHGATCLGPAALASVALASRYPGSKVRGCKELKGSTSFTFFVQTFKATIILSVQLLIQTEQRDDRLCFF